MTELSNKQQPVPDIFVGQVLYREIHNYNAPPEIKEVVVSKIGKKYFYITGWEERYPIDKETLKHEDKNYIRNSFQLYKDKQEIFDLREKKRLLEKLRKYFDWSGNGSTNTLEQLRQAAEILGVS